METLLHAGLSNALAAAFLALLVAGIGLVARRPALMHALWVVVLLKLITPPLWSVPVGPCAGGGEGSVVAGPGDPAVSVAVIGEFEPPSVELSSLAVSEPEVVPPDPVGMVEAPAWVGPPKEEAASWGERVPTWGAVVASTWIAGTLATFGIAAVRVRRFGRLLKEARPAPRDVVDRVAELAARLGLSRPPEVRMMPGAVSPMLWALGCRPQLIVPDDLWERLDGARRDTLLVHELAHLKRRDHLVRGLELLTTGLYWWHPVVWWSRRALHEAEEQCCDAWVVWTFPDKGPTYANALLDTVDFLSGAEPSVPWAASGLGHVRHLKRRLIMILNGTTPRALSWSGALATLGLCAGLLPLSPSWAEDPSGPDGPVIVEERVDEATDPEPGPDAEPGPDGPKEDVLKLNLDLKLLDQAEAHESEFTRVSLDELNSLQKELDELTAKGELSKEDEVRRTAIRNAMKELRRALGERGEDAEAQPDKPGEREGKKGADRRTELREVRVESRDHAEPAPNPDPSPDDSLGDDSTYRGLKERVAELESSYARLRRRIRSQNDPALRDGLRELDSAQREMAAYRHKVLEEVRKKDADLDVARAALREWMKDIEKKRFELKEAESRLEEARRRLAEVGGTGASDVTHLRFSMSNDTPSREPLVRFPFPSPGGRPRPTIVPIPRAGSSPKIDVEPGHREVHIRTVRPPMPPVPPTPPDESRRISELEKKLDRVLEEMKSLKEEKASKSE